MIFAALIVTKIFAFARQVVAVRLLSPNDYGLFALGMTVIGVFVLFGSWLSYGVRRYIPYYLATEDIRGVRGTISATLYTQLITALLLTGLALALASPLAHIFEKPEMKTVLLLLVPAIPLAMCIDTVSVIYLGFKRIMPEVLLRNISLSVLCFLSLFPAILFRSRLTPILLLMDAAYLLVALVAMAYSVYRFPIPMTGEERRSAWKSLFRFSWPLFVVNALWYLIQQSDTLMLGHFVAAERVGAYNAAFLLAQMLGLFLLAINTVYLPVAAELLALQRKEELSEMYYSATKWVFVFALPLFMLMFLYPSTTLTLLFGSAYSQAARALQLICLGQLISTLLGPNVMTLIALEKNRFLMLVYGFVTAVNIFMNLILIPRIGINGAAIASCVSIGLLNAIISLTLYRDHSIHPFRWRYIRALLLFAGFSLIVYKPLLKLLDFSSWILIGYYPFFLLVSLGILMLSQGIDPSDRVLWDRIRTAISVRRRP